MIKTIYDRAEDLFDEVFERIKEMGFNDDEHKEFQLLQAKIRFKILYRMKRNREAEKEYDEKI